MFKSYNTLAEVPEADREHYAQGADGKFYAQVASDHPLLTTNHTLKTEKQTAEAKATRLEGELESAKAGSLPRGHVAVPSAKATLLEQYEPLGTPEELKTVKGEHSTLKAESEANKRLKHLDAVRKAEGWGDSAVDVLSLIQDLPEIEQRDTDEKDERGVPKKKNIAKVKVGDVITEKPFSEYFAEKHAALLPSVVVKEEGTPLPGHGAGGGSNPVDLIEQRQKAREAAPRINPLMPQTASAA